MPVSEAVLRQNQFLDYFHLCSIKSDSKSTETVHNNNNRNSPTRRTSRRVRGSISFARCQTIPFSSPAGILLAKKSKAMTGETQQERLERLERHLIAPVLSSSSRPKWLETEVDHSKWIVTYKTNREKPACDYVHQYRFLNSVKRKPSEYLNALDLILPSVALFFLCFKDKLPRIVHCILSYKIHTSIQCTALFNLIYKSTFFLLVLSIQSQLLYVVCRPVYVLLTRLTPEQVNDLRRDLPKYRCIVRNVSVDNKETVMESQEIQRPNVSSKRKAPSDENDRNSIEKNEEVDSKSEINIIHPTVFDGENSCDRNDTADEHELVKRTALYSKPSASVTVIDLCSSDEEENLYTSTSTDENRDPMNQVTDNVTKSLLQTLSTAKIHLKPHICSTEQRNEWLPDNILHDGRENRANGYHSTTLSAHTSLSSILRPAP